MSYIPKPSRLISVALVFVSVSATSLNAQTLLESSSTITIASKPATDTPTSIDSKKTDVTPTIETPRVAASTAPTKSTGSPEAPVPQTVDQDKWQFQFSPYFWLAGLHGTGGVGNRTTNVDESFSDVFDA